MTTDKVVPTVDNPQWFVMRDLKRSNAKEPAYMALRDAGFEVFTPMRWVITEHKGRRVRREVPYIQDLLFAYASKDTLQPYVDKTPTLQFRYVKGKAFKDPLTVPVSDMNRFIAAARSTDSPVYYSPEEVTPAMYGKKVRIIGGALDGYEGNLLKVKGSRKKQLIIDLPSVLTMTVVVEPQYVQVISN